MKKLTNKQLPTKQTINLVFREKNINDPSRALPLFFVAIFVIAILSKVFVVDRLAQVIAAQNEIDTLQTQKQTLLAEIADYPQIAEDYKKYSTKWMSNDELGLVDREVVLDILEKELMARAEVRDVALLGNSLSVNLVNVNLNDASKIVSGLNSHPEVDDVAVYTAARSSTEQDSRTLSLTITFVPAVSIAETPQKGTDNK